jgi:formylglycine-generating enzyme required for sulfatase activity
MAGNVGEWTSSVFKSYPYNSGDGREWADSSEQRVLRGGSWKFDAWNARAAYRIAIAALGPVSASNNVGFRLALAVPSL